LSSLEEKVQRPRVGVDRIGIGRADKVEQFGIGVRELGEQAVELHGPVGLWFNREQVEFLGEALDEFAYFLAELGQCRRY
jgi:hypothetical protein